MKAVNLIFPHQLFENSELLENGFPIYLIEEFLFFKEFNFHKQKLAFHRASMKQYEAFLRTQGKNVIYIESTEPISDIRKCISFLQEKDFTHFHYIDPVDNWLQERIERSCENYNIERTVIETPLFLNTTEELQPFFRKDKKKYFQAIFYKQQREKEHILIESDGNPTGGKWSFDAENRKKYPAGKLPPSILYAETNEFYREAVSYVSANFPNNIGDLDNYSLYPTSFESSKVWLQQFLEQRFLEFGTYEDAIVAEHSVLNHSVLTPMLNIGLITPRYIISESLTYAIENEMPINSVEGFVRQIIGWREFIRGMYESRGSDARTKNFWGFKRKIPDSFYNGTTGILPVDQTIKKVLKTGYCHHIERLMVMGNFMLLSEIDPDEVYRWFMELFVDSYDWVMVPNVYGMSQFADGGLMATKPYISGSNYIIKMSNYKKGEWQVVWDALFWRFMDTHRAFFKQNPRLGILISSFDKMPVEKRTQHIEIAEKFLEKL